MKGVVKHLIFIIILFATVATKGTFKVHSHSGSWCDYETGLGKVNIQVIQEGQTNDKVSFNMTLVDNEENKYSATCNIDAEKVNPETDEPEQEDKENESEKSDINVDIDTKENEGEDKEEPEKESIDIDVDVEKEDKDKDSKDVDVDVDIDVEKEDKESIDIDVDVEKENKDKDSTDVDVDVDIDVEKEELEKESINVDIDIEKEVLEKESLEIEVDVDIDIEEEFSEIKEVNEKKSSGRRRRLLKKKNLKSKLVKKRKLEERYLSGVCYFDPPKESYNLYYEKGSLVLAPGTEDEVVVEDDFYVIAQKCLSSEEAEKKLDINISFRQLNKFEQKGDTITFYFYGLTNKRFEIGFTIEFYIYLILANGEQEKEERKVTCALEKETAPPSEFIPVQANFKCKIDGLKEQYSSLMFHHSDFIAGVPTEEVYLNPYLTYLEILKGNILDFSLPDNQVKVPTMFVTESIQDSDCESEGTFKINGVIGAEVTEMKKVTIPLTFPTGVEVICKLPPSEAQSKVGMECKFGGEMDKQSLVIEQRIVRHGNEEVFTLGGAKSDTLT